MSNTVKFYFLILFLLSQTASAQFVGSDLKNLRLGNVGQSNVFDSLNGLSGGNKELSNTPNNAANRSASLNMEDEAQHSRQEDEVIVYDNELSRVERDYNDRYRFLVNPEKRNESRYAILRRNALFQYGYETFKPKPKELYEDEFYTVGAVGRNYILGVGDELILNFTGSKLDGVQTVVDREGRVIVPNIGPIAAAGRTFGEFVDSLEELVAGGMIGVQVSVSLGRVKQISVFVSGEVESPGKYNVSGFSTLLDALISAGGVKKSGSLRSVYLVRDGQRKRYDLYDVMKAATSEDLNLADGDAVVVESLGETFAVAGDVVTPGVYELRRGERMTTRKALRASGGPIRKRGSKYLLVSTDKSGKETVTYLKPGEDRTMLAGDFLVVQRTIAVQSGKFRLVGHVHNEGVSSIQQHPTLKSALGNTDNFKEQPYILFAAISRVDPVTQSRQWIKVDLSNVVFGKIDYQLKENDVIVVLSKAEVDFINSDVVQAVLSRMPLDEEEEEEGQSENGESANVQAPPSPDTHQTKEEKIIALLRGEKRDIEATECRGIQALSQVMQRNDGQRFAAVRRATVAGYAGSLSHRDNCPEIFEQYPTLLLFVLENSIALSGEVRAPGAYPVVEGIELPSLMAVAGGLTRDANRASVRVSRSLLDSATGEPTVKRIEMNATQNPSQLLLYPGDFVQVSSLSSDLEHGPVVISGEVNQPGLFDITRGERLSSVVARAGGLRDSAYPFGAVFTRLSIQAEERDWIDHQIEDLENAMVLAASKAQARGKPVAGSLGMLQSITKRLKESEPVGRMVIEADPSILQVRPDEDIVLQAGDRLHMPKRPSHVTIAGEVLSGGSMQYKAAATVRDYLEMAGGMRESADESRIFVIFPNGTAQPVAGSWWSHESVRIPPGSTIMVPRDPVPFDFMAFGLDVADLVSKLAITAASLDALSR